VQSKGQYVMNCFACHGGTLYGTTYPGSPNTTYALESFTEVVRKTKLQLGKPLTTMDMGVLVMPLGTTNGTSNAVMFGVALMNFRDADLNFLADKLPAAMNHHDMDAPPWWNFHRKSHLYIDGFAEKGHKGLMQFMLVRQNGPEKFRAWESEFRDVYQFLEELRPPKYPLAIDKPKAKRGQEVFEHHCAECHGTYGDNQAEYPERMIPIDEINTDRVRFDALTPEHRQAYGDSWFADYGKQDTIAHATGYVAPPLDGIWASAPYLHNGSVPTLWHLLHPDKRPAVWRRIAMACDEEQVGLVVEALDQVPKKLSKGEKRWYFDTQVTGKSAAGHDYPNALTESQKDDLLEYLKTL
jgi:mono/diheme cytochrome c family protein